MEESRKATEIGLLEANEAISKLKAELSKSQASVPSGSVVGATELADFVAKQSAVEADLRQLLKSSSTDIEGVKAQLSAVTEKVN